VIVIVSSGLYALKESSTTAEFTGCISFCEVPKKVMIDGKRSRSS
jgi:hypothetical protein